MWIALIIMLANSAIPNNIVNASWARLNLGGLPINVFDVLLGIGLLTLVIPRRSYLPSDRVHPLTLVILLCALFATIAGLIGAYLNGVTFYNSVSMARNFMVLPIALLIGYRAVPNPEAATPITIVSIISGVCTGVAVFLAWRSGAAEITETHGFDQVRVIEFIGSYAAIGAAACVFLLFSGIAPKQFGVLLIIAAVTAILGDAMSLARSDWLGIAAALAAAIFIIPNRSTASKLVTSGVMTVAALVLALVFSIVVSSITGQDSSSRLIDRVRTMLPGSEQESYQHKAWDSRLPGVFAEVDMWLRSPFTGVGFSGQSTPEAQQRYPEAFAAESFDHNAWTSTMAQTGIFGFIFDVLVVFGLGILGRRLVRDRMHVGFVMIGALGLITAVQMGVLGACTMSFNVIRGAIPLGMCLGMVLRARALQLTMRREYAGYLDEPLGSHEQLFLEPPRGSYDEQPAHVYRGA